MPEIENDWNIKASSILRSILTRKNIKYQELATRLNLIGAVETQSSIANKISRGTFSFVFFLQCMQALGVNDVRLD